MMRLLETRAIAHVTEPRGTVYVHQYVDWTLLWMDEGEMAIAVDDVSAVIDSRTLAFCPPGSSITFNWGPASIRMGYIHFAAIAPLRFVIRHLEPDSVVPLLLRHLLWLAQEEPPEWRTTLTRGLDYALYLLETGYSGSQLRDPVPDSRLIVEVVEWIGGLWLDAPKRSPAVSELATAVNTTPGHLSRVFTERLGVPPHRALLLIRLYHAALLLRHTDMTVAAIAEACGFSRESQFSTAFKRAASVPPTVFRATPNLEFEVPRALRSTAAYLGGTPSAPLVLGISD
jgi:AraC-like DNA-binding protein